MDAAKEQPDFVEQTTTQDNQTSNGHVVDSGNGGESNGSVVAAAPATNTDTTAIADSDVGTKPEVEKVTDSIEKQEEDNAAAPLSSQRRARSNIKATFNLPESSDPDEIRNQVEFYFSDSNLPIDAFLLGQTGGHKNKPIPLKTIHNFKRMQHFQPYSAVRAAVQESKLLDLDSDDNITRKVALDEKFTDDVEKNKALVHSANITRSIYAKGFGQEVGSTHTEIEEFFAPYGPLRSVRLRRHADGEFKGSVFVEFDDEETQKKFLELDPKPQWQGQDLKISSKQEYVDEKHQGILDGIVKPNSHGKGKFGKPNRGRGGRGRGGRGDRFQGRKGERNSERDWRERRDDDNQRRGGRGGGHRGRGRDYNNKRSRDDQDGEDREPKKAKEDTTT